MELHAHAPLPVAAPVPLKAPRILMIRPRKIGDLVLTTPLLRALRQAYPDCHTTYLTEPWCGEILANHPAVDERLDYPADGNWGAYLRLAARLRGERYDVVIDAFGSPATARLTRLTRAPWRIGPRLRGRTWAYNRPATPSQRLRYVAAVQALLLRPLGVTVDDLDTDLHPGPDAHEYAESVLRFLGVADEPLVAIAPGAAQAHRRWAPEAYARVADALAQRWGVRVLLLHDAGEVADACATREAMVRPAAADLAPTKSLPQLAALLARCRMFIGNDTGTRHIAIAMRVPTVGIFGKARPQAWTPPDDPRHRTVAFDPGCKSHCTFPRCTAMPCIREVTPQAVLAEAEALLATRR